MKRIPDNINIIVDRICVPWCSAHTKDTKEKPANNVRVIAKKSCTRFVMLIGESLIYTTL